MSWALVGSAAIGAVSAYSSNKSAKKAASSTETREMDERVVPYIFGSEGGNSGLLQMTQDQLMRSRSPQRMQGWETMMNRGGQLLGGSVAGNPFSAGYKGGTDFFKPSMTAGMGNGLLQYTPPPLMQQPMPQQQQFQGLTMEQLQAELGRFRQELPMPYHLGDTAG